jgi:hypothetical protein
MYLAVGCVDGALFSCVTNSGGAHDIIFGSKFVRRSRDERRHHFLEPLQKKTNHEQKIVKHGKHTQHFFHGTQKTWCHAKNNGVCGMIMMLCSCVVVMEQNTKGAPRPTNPFLEEQGQKEQKTKPQRPRFCRDGTATNTL